MRSEVPPINSDCSCVNGLTPNYRNVSRAAGSFLIGRLRINVYDCSLAKAIVSMKTKQLILTE